MIELIDEICKIGLLFALLTFAIFIYAMWLDVKEPW